MTVFISTLCMSGSMFAGAPAFRYIHALSRKDAINAGGGRLQSEASSTR